MENGNNWVTMKDFKVRAYEAPSTIIDTRVSSH